MTPQERAEIDKLAKTAAIVNDNHGIQYIFRGNAAKVFTENYSEFILSGGSETGKTVACLTYLNQLAWKYPKMQGAIVRKWRADMDGTVLLLFRQKIIGDSPIFIFGGNKPEWYEYPNGSRLWVGGIDRPGRVLSGELDAVYVNQAEELNVEDWETLGTRTTGRAGIIVPGTHFGDCNPRGSSHWILQRANAGALTFLPTFHQDNPALYDDSGKLTEQGERTIKKLSNLTGVRRKRLLEHQWVMPEGVVYENWDANIHLIDPFPIPADWRRIRVIDFGYTNPFVCQWWAIDPDGRMYRYREIYMTQRTVRVHAGQINELSKDEQIEATICDHDAEDRATLDECGIPNMPAIKDVSPGIQAVTDRLKVAGDDKPRIFLFKNSLVERDPALEEARKPLCTEEEVEVYLWNPVKGGKSQKEEPLKENDHGMDTERYAVMYVDYAPTWYMAEL